MGAFRAFQCRSRCGWIEQQLDEATLILDREPDEEVLLNRPLRGFSGSSDDEIADAPALDLGGAFHDSERFRGNARFNPCGAMRFGHQGRLSFDLHCTVMPRTPQAP
jgi:hypothetical protein